MDDTGTDGTRRGLFRRTRRSDDSPATDTEHAASTAVATVDDLARRMDELVGEVQDGPAPAAALAPPTDEGAAQPVVRPSFDMQRAITARAADAPATAAAVPTSPTAPEAPVQHTTSDDLPLTDDADIEARLDAALQAVSMSAVQPTAAAPAAPAPATVTLDPTPAPTAATPEPAQAAEFAPLRTPLSSSTFVPGSGSSSAASAIGIDVDRIVQLIEDEAVGVQHRIELELRTAHGRAEEIVDRAEHEAERIREHGQQQARVLLSEVEEIISEAQQTGEQILLRANEESGSLRGEATAVLQQSQTEARAIVETARREGEQVLAEQRRLATVRAQEAMREQDRLKDQIRRLEERRRQVLESLEPLISQLTQMMPTAIPAAQHDQQNVVQLQRQTQG